MMIIDGKKEAENIWQEIKKEIESLKSKDNNCPGLTVILIGDFAPSQIYVKNKEKALYTVNTIKNRPVKYQVNVIATMLGRAKKHPYKTKEMNDAIKVFSKWMSNYKESSKK